MGATVDQPPQRIRISLLGAVAVEIGSASVDLGGPRQRAVFAALALAPNRVVPRARLVDAVWGDEPPSSAKSTLQAYISRLRRVIEPSGAATIEHTSAGYALRVDPASLDLERFAESVRDGRRALATGVFDLAATRFGEALDHWRGEPLADLQGYAFADAERVRLGNERHAVVADRIDADLAAGRHESVVAELEALVLAAPLHEPFWIRLMIALYRCDRQADALAAYQSAHAALLDQLGIDPGPALVATEAAILRQDPALGVEAVVPGSAAEPRSRRTVDARHDGLVGREVELAALDDRLDQLQHRGGLVVVSGPAGIGKTALLGTFVDRARSRPIPAFWGRAWEGEGAPAFWPWIEVLRQWADEIGHDEVRALAGRRLAHLTRLLPELAIDSTEATEGPAPSQAQFALYDVVAGLLADSAERVPLVIVLDDLQWADASSVELLKFLATRLGETRVLVVATRRDPATTTDTVAAALRGLEVVAPDLRLPLGPLADAEIAEVVARSTRSAVAGSVVDEIVERSEGLPFFAVELARAAAHRDGSFAVPSTLRETIVRRLDQLAPGAQALLRVAAVAGDEFSLAIVGEATSQRGADLLGSLEEAITAGVVQPVAGQPDRYRFEHALVREALHSALGPADLVARHAQLADALANMTGPGSEEHIVERAHHALEAATAAPSLEAVDLAEAASMLALRSFGYEEAVGWLERATPVLKACGDEARACDLLLRRGEIENRAGWAERAKATHLLAADAARAMGSGPQMARAADGYAFTRMDVQIVDEIHLGLCAEADALLDRGDSAARAALLASWGNAHYWGDASEGRRLVDQAVAMARRVDDPAVLGSCLLASAWLAYGDGPQRIEVGREMLEIARRTRDVEMELWGHRWVHVGIFDAEGPTDRCRSSLATYVDRADEARQPHHRWFGALYRGNFALVEGRMADAEVLIDEAFAIGQTAEPITATQYYGAQMFCLRWLQGRMDELIPLAEVTVAQYPEVHTWRALLAYLYAATDQPDKARQRLVELEAIGWDSITSGGTLIMAHGLAAEAAARAGCIDIAEVLLPRIVAHVDHYVHMAFVVTMGPARFFRGRLLGVLGDIDGAIDQFELAESADLGRRLPPLLVRDRLALAGMLEKRASGDDARRADRLRTQAEVIAAEMGMDGIEYL